MNKTAKTAPASPRPRPKAYQIKRHSRSKRQLPKPKPRLRAVLKMFPPAILADICGVTRQSLFYWKDIPPRYALKIEAASGGKFTKEWLAPDFYPAPAG